MNDVAESAGVGTMTVSRVLNGSVHVSEQTAERVRRAVAALGYRPNEMARALRNAKSRTIGLLLPNLHDTFYATCAHSLNMVANAHDYTVLLTLTNDDSSREYREAQRMLQRHVEGMVVIPAGSDRCRLDEREFREIPVVMLDRPLEGAGAGEADSVVTENEAGARLLTEHLLAVHGLRRILFLGHRSDLYTMDRRHRGYAGAMRAAGLQSQSDFTCASEADTERVLRAALAGPAAPEAIFAGNVVFEPLVGFDDLELGDLLHPALTVVRQPAEELGKTAGRVLFAKLKNQVALREVSETVLPVELLVRHSCGCPYRPGPA